MESRECGPFSNVTMRYGELGSIRLKQGGSHRPPEAVLINVKIREIFRYGRRTSRDPTPAEILEEDCGVVPSEM